MFCDTAVAAQCCPMQIRQPASYITVDKRTLSCRTIPSASKRNGVSTRACGQSASTAAHDSLTSQPAGHSPVDSKCTFTHAPIYIRYPRHSTVISRRKGTSAAPPGPGGPRGRSGSTAHVLRPSPTPAMPSASHAPLQTAVTGTARDSPAACRTLQPECVGQRLRQTAGWGYSK